MGPLTDISLLFTLEDTVVNFALNTEEKKCIFFFLICSLV